MSQQGVRGVQVGLPRDRLDARGRAWRSGFAKESVVGRVRLGREQLAGDGQADRDNHGGPDKALCVYPHAHYPGWVEVLGTPLPLGAFGENLTIDGATEHDVCIGDTYRLGNATVQVSQPRSPCWKLARHWDVKDLAVRVQRTGRTGWYLRVLEEGELAAGGELELLARPHPDLTVAEANRVRHHDRGDLDAARALVACAALADGWRGRLARRLDTGDSSEETGARLHGGPS